ncbi:MAG: hypothetical protein EXR79_02865 [Myxococcales bacterium]|nr:hypothetical protein [Myxococcales bacterium]
MTATATQRPGRTPRTNWRVTPFAALAVLAVPTPGAALVVQVNSIQAATGSAVKPNERLGLGVGLVSPAVKHVINVADCELYRKNPPAKVAVSWTWTDRDLTVATPQYSVKVAPAGKTCETGNLSESSKDGACKLVAEKVTYASPPVSTTVDLADLITGTDCRSGASATAKIYFVVSDDRASSGAASQVNGVTLDVAIQLSVPATPTLATLAGGESNLHVTWSFADKTKIKGARVYWSAKVFSPNDLGAVPGRSATLTTTSYQITGLKNGQTYFVSVTAVDDDENESAGAPLKTAEPRATQDFWQYYQASGGSEEGGYAICSAGRTPGPASVLVALLVAVALALLVRRRRPAWGLRAGVSLVACAVLGVGSVGAPSTARAASPQTMSLDLRVAKYLPQIDREFGKTAGGNGTGKTPFADVLKSSDWQVSLALDWRVAHGVLGELGLGVAAGLWDQEGKARALAGGTTDDKTSLHVVPVTLDLVWRFDTLAERYRLFLIPYARLGVGAAVWWVENGLGNVATFARPDGTSRRAEGMTGGLHATAGLRLLLDVFEPQAARGFDIEMGVNHSYLFLQWQRLSLTDFGSAKSIDLSDDLIHFGFAFDL